jgi:hypothetical protein
MSVETMPAPKARKGRPSAEFNEAERTKEIATAVDAWRALNDSWSSEPGNAPPPIEWWSALIDVVRVIAAAPLPLRLRPCVVQAERLANAIVVFAARDVDLDWNQAKPTHQIFEAVEPIEGIIHAPPLEPPEPQTVARLDAIGDARGGTIVTDFQILRICKISAKELVEERRNPGSVCDEQWRQKMQAAWLADRQSEFASEPDSEVLTATLQKLSGIGLEE